MHRILVVCACLLLCACQREGGHMRAAVPELSGLVKSQRLSGVFWAHGDSGNDAELWAIDATGRTLGRYSVAADNHDWEDIAADPEGNLYLGDIGDNFKRRDDLQIVQVREPSKLAKRGALEVAVIQPYRFPTGVDGKPQHFDAEALFFAAGHLYLLSKDRFSTKSVLYRFPSALSSTQVTLERVASVELRTKKTQGAAPVTAADVSRDQTRVAITSYRHLYVFRFDAQRGQLRERLYQVRLPDQDGFEALAFDGDHLLAARESGQLVPFVLPAVARPGP